MPRAVVVLFALAAAACSLNALDGFSSGGAPADVTDGSVAADEARDAAVDVATSFANDVDGGESNLAPNPGFEDTGDVSCGMPYLRESFHAQLSSVMSPRSGARACRVCNVAGPVGENFTLDPYGYGFAEVTPGRYEIEAWVRMDDGAAIDVTVSLRVYRDGLEREFLSAPFATTGPSWTRLHAVVEVEHAGSGELLLVSAIRNQRNCFLVDDLLLRRVD